MPHGINGDVGVKFSGFDDKASYLKNDAEDPIKKKFENYPGGLFTVPNPSVAYSNNVGGDEGGFNA